MAYHSINKLTDRNHHLPTSLKKNTGPHQHCHVRISLMTAPDVIKITVEIGSQSEVCHSFRHASGLLTLVEVVLGSVDLGWSELYRPLLL